jgi:hypothetical protein
MELRRSDRLKDKLFFRYRNEYLSVSSQVTIIVNPIIKAQTLPSTGLSALNKLLVIIKLMILMSKKCRFILTYESKFLTSTSNINTHENLCDMLYVKSFEWIKDTTAANKNQIEYMTKIDALTIKKFQMVVKKYRKNYENIRYANWNFIRIQYNLDSNIMFCINSYINYYTPNF